MDEIIRQFRKVTSEFSRQRIEAMLEREKTIRFESDGLPFLKKREIFS